MFCSDKSYDGDTMDIRPTPCPIASLSPTTEIEDFGFGFGFIRTPSQPITNHGYAGCAAAQREVKVPECTLIRHHKRCYRGMVQYVIFAGNRVYFDQFIRMQRGLTRSITIHYTSSDGPHLLCMIEMTDGSVNESDAFNRWAFKSYSVLVIKPAKLQ